MREFDGLDRQARTYTHKVYALFTFLVMLSKVEAPSSLGQLKKASLLIPYSRYVFLHSSSDTRDHVVYMMRVDERHIGQKRHLMFCWRKSLAGVDVEEGHW